MQNKNEISKCALYVSAQSFLNQVFEISFNINIQMQLKLLVLIFSSAGAQAIDFALPEKYSEFTDSTGYIGPTDSLGDPHGSGYEKGYIYYYEGTFSHGKFEGEGMLYEVLGTVPGQANAIIKGNFHKGELHGWVEIYWPSGSYKKANFVNGVADGSGEYFFAFLMDKTRGVLLKGYFKGDEFPSEGTLIFPNGDTYEGPVSKDKPHGKGLYRTADGIVYKGDFVLGDLSGRGSISFPDGRFYQGDVTLTGINGQGVLMFPGGARYEGEFADGEFSGQGLLIEPNGVRIEGEFWNGKPSGMVSARYADGTIYSGEMLDGKPSGQGELIRSDGFRFKGLFYDGNPDGKGLCAKDDPCTFRDGVEVSSES